MSDREIASMAFMFAFVTTWQLFNWNAREYGLNRSQAAIGAFTMSGAGIGIAYVLTKWIVG